MTHFTHFALAAAVLASAFAAPASAEDAKPIDASSRLVIVDGRTDQVIYDDGRNDLFCVSRVHGYYDSYGYHHHRRTMRCR